MPQIKEITAPTDTLRPTETGVEALAGAGRRAGAFYNQAAESIRQSAQDQARAAFAEANAKEERAKSFGNVAKSFGELGEQAEQSYAHHEISHGAATFAELHSQLTDQWNNTVKNADPNDQSVAGQFHDQVLEPALDNFRKSFNTQQGQQFAEREIESLRSHMYEKTSADMSTLAGDAVATNVRKTTNAWSNTARSDPSAVPFLLDTAGAHIGDIVSTSPNLKGADSARARIQLTQTAKEDIVRAGALGVAEKASDPEAAVNAYVKRYPELMKPGEADQLINTATRFRRLNDAESRASETEARRQATGAFHRDMNQLELSTIDENGNSVMPSDLVRKLKDTVAKYGEYADPSRVNAMVARVKELGRTLDPASAANLKKTSDSTERQLYTQMVLPQPGAEPLTEDKINTEYSKGNLQFAARNRLLKDLQDDKSPDGQTLAKARTDFFRNYAATIDPGRDQTTGLGASALGSQRIGEAQQEARRLEGVLRSQGKDPHSLYDPSSPDFFGKQVNRFRATLQEKANFDAQLKADQDRKQAIPGTITGVDVKEAPARPKGFPEDATRDPNGQWYVIRNGIRYRVDQKPDKQSSLEFHPTMIGAKQAKDGNYYLPDPTRPGKYLMVVRNA